MVSESSEPPENPAAQTVFRLGNVDRHGAKIAAFGEENDREYAFFPLNETPREDGANALKAETITWGNR